MECCRSLVRQQGATCRQGLTPCCCWRPDSCSTRQSRSADKQTCRHKRPRGRCFQCVAATATAAATQHRLVTCLRVLGRESLTFLLYVRVQAKKLTAAQRIGLQPPPLSHHHHHQQPPQPQQPPHQPQPQH